MIESKPTVSIGLPVYNGAQYLRQTMNSLLSQEYENFELIVCDNVSTDDTYQIALEYAAKDSRVKVYQNEENIGATRNFSRVLELTQGEFFMWASCHDLWNPKFISRCLEAMQADQDVVLCFPKACEIDEADKPLGTLRGRVNTRGMGKTARYRKVIRKISGYACYGIYKTDALRRISPLGNSLGPDAILLAELSFMGTYAYVPEELFSLRRMSVSRNWRRYFSNLRLKFSLWNFLRLYGWFIRDYLSIVRKHTDMPSERISLSVFSIAIVLFRTIRWFGAILISMIYPKFYYPW